MESAFRVIILLLFLDSSKSQNCNNGPYDVSLCDPAPPGAWLSNITGTLNGDGTYSVAWDLDPKLPPGEPNYAVVLMRQSMMALEPRILMPTENFEGFQVMDLVSNARYEIMVCNSNINQDSVMPGSQCGFCRVCARIEPPNQAPRITEAVINEFPGRETVYICEADGFPIPTIRWRATDQRNGAEVRISNNTPNIKIVNSPPDTVENEISSELMIFRDADFEMPICVAENSLGRVTMSEFSPEVSSSVTVASTIMDDLPFPEYAIAIIAIVPLVVIVTVILLLVCICMYCRLKKKSARDAYDIAEQTCETCVTESSLMTKNTSIKPSTTKNTSTKPSILENLPKDMIISHDRLQVSTIIGQGEFGLVYKGYLKSSKSNMVDTVAIKTLKGIFATASDIEAVSEEIQKMKRFNHSNVMPLIGVCVGPSDGGSSGPCIVMPFMAKGSLLSYLRDEADNLFVEKEDDKNMVNVRVSLLQMCLQIAKGMEYLANLKFIHRDLAARNCLMDMTGIIKVSDFGLAEDIYSQNYFRQIEGGIKLPLKWMSLESIRLGVFTEKSDVWSFGITCWEIFSGGSIPYPGVHPHSILDFLESDQRLSKPKNAACCGNMYALMLSCWERKENSRPTFSSIVSTLVSYMEISSDYLDLSTFKAASADEKNPPPESIQVPDDKHGLFRVVSNPNDYYKAGEC